MTQSYRLLIQGELIQQSALVVGGASNDSGMSDMPFARDGRGRLTIPGTGLMGALVETAGRIFPDLFDAKTNDETWGKVSGKRRQKPGSDAKFLQSTWLVRPAHLLNESSPTPEYRQGVGINQQTGATARDQHVLFDMETIPCGSRWSFFLEIDAFHGGITSTQVALAALAEWVQERCWLGASAARGLGWMSLENLQLLTLPLSPAILDLWPDNSRDGQDVWDDLAKLPEVQIETFSDSSAAAERLLTMANTKSLQPKESGFWYLTVDAELVPGLSADGFGLDALSIGGHATGFGDRPSNEYWLHPQGMDPNRFMDESELDAPVTVTRSDTESPYFPFLPGSGLRGPLRHSSSRWWRTRLPAVDDHQSENQPAKGIPDPNSADEQTSQGDRVSSLFGLATTSGRLLVRDAFLADPAQLSMVLFQHHAEDEFAGSVYGSGKFDRAAVVGGRFPVRFVLEACDLVTLLADSQTLQDTLQLAELGHLPVGHGKWRGLGWVPWKFLAVRLERAGNSTPIRTASNARIKSMLEQVLSGGKPSDGQ